MSNENSWNDINKEHEQILFIIRKCIIINI